MNVVLSIYLKVSLLFNVFLTIVGFVMLFLATDTYSIYAATIGSISALANSIGLTMLLRRRYMGVLIIGSMSLISAVTVSITCDEWLTSFFGKIGILLPYIIFALYVSTLIIFLIFAKSEEKTIWQKTNGGFDYRHFRHIYMLSAFFSLAILITAIIKMQEQDIAELETEGETSDIIIAVPVERLDATDITIEEVMSFEKQYNESVDANSRDSKITQRTFALKHLLLCGLMPEFHSRENLVDIIKVYSNEFSSEQQKILDWYLSLDIVLQEEWNNCNKAISISDFENQIKERIK